jgi:hypothetical protein
MKEKLWTPVELKDSFPPIKKIPDHILNDLSVFLKKVEKPAKSILKAAGEIEAYSRIIISGHVGMFRRNKLTRVYFPGEICMDITSFFQQLPSEFELRAIDRVEHTMLTFSDEKKVLALYPELSGFSEELISMVRNSDNYWFELTQQKWLVSLDYLEQRWPTYRAHFSKKEIAGLLNISERTISRHFEQEMGSLKSESFFQNVVSQISYPFKGERFADAEEIDRKIVCWAHGIHGFMHNEQDVKKYQAMKLSWLSAYLYPEADWESSLWIGKLYALLFGMDDLTDHLPEGGKADFWMLIVKGFGEVLECKDVSIKGFHVLPFIYAFQDLWESLGEFEQTDKSYREFLKEEFRLYLDSNLWESQNRDKHRIPEISEYLIQRPVFSGGQLALSLIPLGMGDPFSEIKEAWDKSLIYRQLGAKLIFITNDLFSYQKEKRDRDFHNWLKLLVVNEKKSESAAKEFLIQEHNKTLEEFLNRIQGLSNPFNPDNDTLLAVVKQVKFQVAGAVEWSIEGTNRYLIDLKEKQKPN